MSNNGQEEQDDLVESRAELLRAKAAITNPAVASSSKERSIVTSMDKMISGFIKFDGLADLFQRTVKGYSLQDPFLGGEITVNLTTLSSGPEDRTFIGKTKEPMSVVGNKPFNVLLALWLHELGSNEKTHDEFDKYVRFFNFVKCEEFSQELYIFNCKALLFGQMLLMTRGSIPSKAEGNKNPLPKLMAVNLGYKTDATEQAFAEDYAGFDIRKVQFAEFLKVPINSFPDAIKNRMLKGFAGSRVLKLFTIAATYGEPVSKDPDNVKVFKVMCEIAGLGKCYLNLHPLRQVVQASVPDFYAASVSLIAENIGEVNFGIFLRECLLIPTFGKDRMLNNVSWTNGVPKINGADYTKGFKMVTPESLKKLFGTSVTSE